MSRKFFLFGFVLAAALLYFSFPALSLIHI